MTRTRAYATARIFQPRTVAPGWSAAGRGKPAIAPVAPRSGKASLLADRRGAVAFETLLVYSVLLLGALLPAADLAAFGFQYISALEALRAFGQYVQYNPPTDVTTLSTSCAPAQSTTNVSGYTISKVAVYCGDTSAVCGNANTASPKYYSYTTTVSLTPMVLSSALCTSSNTNKCSFTLSYSERFQ